MKWFHLSAVTLALISGIEFFVPSGKIYYRKNLKIIFFSYFYCVDTCLLSYRWSNQSSSPKWVVYSDSSA